MCLNIKYNLYKKERLLIFYKLEIKIYRLSVLGQWSMKIGTVGNILVTVNNSLI